MATRMHTVASARAAQGGNVVPRRGSVQTCVAKLASAGTQCAAANLKNNWQEDWVSNGMLWEAAEAPASDEVLVHKTAHQPLTQQDGRTATIDHLT